MLFIKKMDFLIQESEEISLYFSVSGIICSYSYFVPLYLSVYIFI